MPFMDENFLLNTETARDLYFNFASRAPIFDFHCHLNPKAVYENAPFRNLTEAWLGGDHYKWRAMRAIGIGEEYATGDAPDDEKFFMFVKTLENAPGNPLYHWAHLELQRYFGVYEPLTNKNARRVYEKVNAMLNGDGFTPRDFIKKSNVKIIFTTDDPADSLEYHDKLAADKSFGVKIAPAFRPDKLFNTNPGGEVALKKYIKLLADAAGVPIVDFDGLKTALVMRMDHFEKRGAKASDHAFACIPYAASEAGEAERIFSRLLAGESVPEADADKYKTALIVFLAGQYYKRGWVMELHYGATRNNNTRMFNKLGPDTGFDSIGDRPSAENLIKLLDKMDMAGGLPKTMLFPINPGDFYTAAALMGSFQTAGDDAGVQFGSAWWFNDHIDGMTYQIKTLANVGVLGRFTGMLTDSRSFLSYPRHEYFRRIFTDILGGWVENGGFYLEREDLGRLVADVCYGNAVKYFGV